MDAKKRTGAALLLLAIALLAGVFLSGWMVLALLGVRSVPLTWRTYGEYAHAMHLPEVAPYAGRIGLAGVAGFGLPLLLWIAALVPLCRRKAEALHGAASLARLSELRQAGLLKQTPQGILIGRYRGCHLWLGGARHVIAISPTRSGKTTSIAIPVLLTYRHSAVVLDLKGELRKATSGWRRSQGQAIHVWAPYDERGRTHRFNPFTLLAGCDAGRRIGEIQTMAAILYPDEAGRDPFWTAQSRAAFTAFASFLFERWDRLWQAGLPSEPNRVASFPSFERILRASSGEPGRDTRAMLQSIRDEPAAWPGVSQQTRTVFGNLAGLAEQTFSSVMATMQAPLLQFLNPILAAATNATDFDVTALRKRPATLYVDIPTHKLDESGKLLNIFFSTVIGHNLTQPLGAEPDLRYQVLMLMDEFTAMGRLDAWSRRIAIAAGYGVRDLCIVQSRAQLRGTYGDDDAQNFITNHAAQIVFAPREQDDANAYSEMMGYKTLRRKQRSRSRGGGTIQVSTSVSEERRALYLPQEIKQLPHDDELIFLEGCKPIRAEKNWFFRDRTLRARAAIAPVDVVAAPGP